MGPLFCCSPAAFCPLLLAPPSWPFSLSLSHRPCLPALARRTFAAMPSRLPPDGIPFRHLWRACSLPLPRNTCTSLALLLLLLRNSLFDFTPHASIPHHPCTY